MNVCRTVVGINPANSGTTSRCDTMWSMGRNPQRAENGVKAIAISGLWFPSLSGVSERDDNYSFTPTFIDVGFFGMQFLRSSFVGVCLYAQSLFDGQDLEQKRQDSVCHTGSVHDPFTSVALILFEIVRE